MSENQKKSPGLTGTEDRRFAITLSIIIGAPLGMSLTGITIHPAMVFGVIVAAIALGIWSFEDPHDDYMSPQAILTMTAIIFILFVHAVLAGLTHDPRIEGDLATVDTVIEYANENGYSEIRLEAHHSPKFRESSGSDFTTPTRTTTITKAIYQRDHDTPVFESLTESIENPSEGEEVCRDIGPIRGKTAQVCEPRVNNVDIKHPMIIALDDNGEVESVTVEQG